jgi:transcription elongation GreA/GreB family factor
MSVAFVREESAETAQEVTLPARAISPYPNLVTASGLKALQAAETAAHSAAEAAQQIADVTERRRAREAAARDLEYFSERLRSAELRPEPGNFDAVVFGSRVTILRDDQRRQTFRIVGEDEADPRVGSISYVSPLARLLTSKRVGDFVDLDGHEIEILAIG